MTDMTALRMSGLEKLTTRPRPGGILKIDHQNRLSLRIGRTAYGCGFKSIKASCTFAGSTAKTARGLIAKIAQKSDVFPSSLH